MDYEGLADELLGSLRSLLHEKGQPMNSDAFRGRGYVLLYLARHGGQAYPGEISKAMDVTTSRITAAIASLEEQGMVMRVPSSSDRRKVLVTLTDAGKAYAQVRRDETRGLAIDMLEGLGEKDAREYVRITQRISELHLEQEGQAL